MATGVVYQSLLLSSKTALRQRHDLVGWNVSVALRLEEEAFFDKSTLGESTQG